MPRHRKKQAVPSKCKVGDEVRVKHGVRDTDYQDIPLDAWAGTICEVQRLCSYNVRWRAETLAICSTRSTSMVVNPWSKPRWHSLPAASPWRFQIP